MLHDFRSSECLLCNLCNNLRGISCKEMFVKELFKSNRPQMPEVINIGPF